jgi:hypothetical protein
MYMSLREGREQWTGEKCTMTSFINFTPHQILFDVRIRIMSLAGYA